VALEPRMNKITADKTGAASGKDHIGWIILKVVCENANNHAISTA
jgi:hypothetical protein